MGRLESKAQIPDFANIRGFNAYLADFNMLSLRAFEPGAAFYRHLTFFEPGYDVKN